MLFCLLYSFIVDGIKIISPTIPDSVLIMIPIFVLKKYLLYLNIVLLFLLYMPLGVKGQDPHFTQFNAAPITINPNYVGVFDGNVRITSNQRRQWFNHLGSRSDPKGGVKITLVDQ